MNLEDNIRVYYTSPYKVTARKLRRVLRFVQKRRIPMRFRYEYNNSMGHHHERTYEGTVETYRVDKIDYDDGIQMTVHIQFEGGGGLQESVDDFAWTIARVRPNPMRGMVLIGNNGDGTYDYFVMQRMDFK